MNGLAQVPRGHPLAIRLRAKAGRACDWETGNGEAQFCRVHARDLNAALVSRYPMLPCVRDFHEQYRQVVTSPSQA